jgi:Tat protein translocase TatB subunit
MFSGIGLSEILLVMLIALLVMGPEKLPDAARKLGKGIREVRRASNMFRDMFMLDDELDYARRDRRRAVDEAGAEKGAEKGAAVRGAAVGALGSSIARGTQKRAPSRPVLLSEARRPTHIQKVEIQKVAAADNLRPSAHGNACTFEELPAPRRIEI